MRYPKSYKPDCIEYDLTDFLDETHQPVFEAHIFLASHGIIQPPARDWLFWFESLAFNMGLWEQLEKDLKNNAKHKAHHWTKEFTTPPLALKMNRG